MGITLLHRNYMVFLPEIGFEPLYLEKYFPIQILCHLHYLKLECYNDLAGKVGVLSIHKIFSRGVCCLLTPSVDQKKKKLIGRRNFKATSMRNMSAVSYNLDGNISDIYTKQRLIIV